MSVLDSKDTHRNLKKKGFIDSPGDHKRLEYYYNDKLILHTKISHGSKKDLDDYLIRQMSVQCQLDKMQFVDLAKCPLSKGEYLKILRKKKLL
ncbi:MAG TPA: hypothetical protein VGA21_08875 [Cyclobacteriaceae bacterium]|jgi:hypothetical protein